MSHPILDLKVPIKLDRLRHLKIDFNALATIEKAGGRSIITPESWQQMGIKDVRTMLRASLQHEDPALTDQQVGRLIHTGNMKTVVEKMGEAWKLAFNGPEGQGLPPLEVRPDPQALPA